MAKKRIAYATGKSKKLESISGEPEYMTLAAYETRHFEMNDDEYLLTDLKPYFDAKPELFKNMILLAKNYPLSKIVRINGVPTLYVNHTKASEIPQTRKSKKILSEGE